MTVSQNVYDICGKVAKALNAELPAGFRGVLRIVVDDSGVKPHNITVEFRPPQPGQRSHSM